MSYISSCSYTGYWVFIASCSVVAAAATAWLAVTVERRRREKLVNGELDPFKQVAGIVVCSCYTFLAWYAEIIRRDQKLYASFQLYNGEYADRNIYALVVPAAYQVVFKHTADISRNRT